MTVENATYINGLNKAYPRNRDLIKEGDDHIRLIKSALQSTFPSVDSAVIASSEKLNKLDTTFTYEESTLKINNNIGFKKDAELDFGGSRLRKIGEPKDPDDAVTLKSLQGSLMWPVGSIFMTLDARDPKDIFGFGNWEKFAQGRVIVGVGTSTDTNNETPALFANEGKGGNYNTKLEEKNTPKHSHAAGTLKAEGSGDHDHTVDLRVHSYAVVNNNDWVVPHGDIAGEDRRFQNTQGAKTTKGGGQHSHTLTGATESFGSGEAFSNMMPYIGCNIWVRRADTKV
ncbi:MAG: phage baseplate protein [Bacteroidales bacterium]